MIKGNQMTTFKYWEHSELEVIDYVTEHLLKQRAVSTNSGACLYHHPNGLKCAAGCLIDESIYSESIEGMPWDHVIKKIGLPSTHCRVIFEMQTIHDQVDVRLWPEALAELREEYV
jgi:hypothetical protein